MAALHAAPTLRTVADLDVEAAYDGVHRREIFLILRGHAGHFDGAAAGGTRLGDAGRMGLVDPRRTPAASLPPVPCTGSSAWTPAAALPPVLGEGRGLSAAGPPGGVELLLEVVAAPLPPVAVADSAYQVLVQLNVLPLELLDALVSRLLLPPGRLRPAASAAPLGHTPCIGTCARSCTPLRGFSRPYPVTEDDQAGHLPSFVSVTEGKTGDVKAARTWTFPAGSVVVADRAYLDFKWFHQLQARGVTFVTRLKRGVRYRVTREHDIRPGTGVLSDQTIELTSARSRRAYAAPLRRVAYQDPVTKNRYVFVTNNTTWVAQTIADIYKSRWQIELFFKWIKQHLKVKRFVGRSKNAVMTQLWVAMCMYLLLAYLKFVMRLRWSLHQMLQVLQLNMFERRPLQDLFTTPSLPAPSGSQLSLAWS